MLTKMVYYLFEVLEFERVYETIEITVIIKIVDCFIRYNFSYSSYIILYTLVIQNIDIKTNKAF